MRGNLGLLLVAVAAALVVGGGMAAAEQYPTRARFSTPPTAVTSPATGAGTDTCTGNGCAIGPSGFSTDGGIRLALTEDICLDNTTCAARLELSATPEILLGTPTNSMFIALNLSTGLARVSGAFTAPSTITSNIASGSVALQTLTGAKTCLGSAGVGCLTYQTASTSLEQSLGVGTAGSGTGITVVASGALRPFVHKVTVAFGAMTAAATTDITLWTLPAKARLSRVVADYTVVFAGGALSDVDVTCGKTAGANEYLVTHDVDTAIGTYGVAAAEIGASLLSATAADVNWATQAVICRFTCAGANCNAATTGSATYYLEGVSYP